MKLKYYICSILLLCSTLVMACPVCEEREPKLTRGLTHGATPDSNWDWVIVAFIALLTVLTLIYSIRFLVNPKENQNNHIKNSILTSNND